MTPSAGRTSGLAWASWPSTPMTGSSWSAPARVHRRGTAHRPRRPYREPALADPGRDLDRARTDQRRAAGCATWRRPAARPRRGRPGRHRTSTPRRRSTGYATHLVTDPEVAGAPGGLGQAHRCPSCGPPSSGTKLVQLTLPGVADVYQGTESLVIALVDPDNRGPVDAERPCRAVGPAGPGRQPVRALADEKLALTAAALRLRRAIPGAFVGARAGYLPLPTSTGHAVAFVRTQERQPRAVTVVTRLTASLTRTVAGTTTRSSCPRAGGATSWTDPLQRRSTADPRLWPRCWARVLWHCSRGSTGRPGAWGSDCQVARSRMRNTAPMGGMTIVALAGRSS